MKLLYNVDLDNTLIYSYKHDIGSQKRCAEIYQGREISFMTEKTHELLIDLHQRIMIVPTTTRTIEQYERIDLGIGKFPYALVCNGGILLVEGESDPEWYEQSLELIAESREVLQKGITLMEEDLDRCFEVRFIENLFLFTKSNQPQETVQRLSNKLDTSTVDVFHNGMKVYVVPKRLSKGMAVSRLKEKLKADIVFAAGDSEFDISMLQCADIAVAPESLQMDDDKSVKRIAKTTLFSEGQLAYIQEKILNFTKE